MVLDMRDAGKEVEPAYRRSHTSRLGEGGSRKTADVEGLC